MPAWLTENAKWIAVGAAALIVIIAFCVGFSKGFTRLSWGRADLDGRLRAVFRAGKEISRFQSRPENGIDE